MAEKIDVVAPVIHLNGTSKDELLSLREAAYSALDAVLDALRKMAPNGRDYYPDPGRMERALEQHKRRGEVVHQIMREIEAECTAINGC